MSPSIEIRLTLSADTPGSMSFQDTYDGLENIWYRFDSDEQGNITVVANEDGFEHLARMFLKFARGKKSAGYHSHFALEFGTDQHAANRELTVGIVRDALPPLRG